MTDLELCFARLSECRSEAAIEAVLDAAWEKIKASSSTSSK